MQQQTVSLNDIKFDLLKIIEPHDGLLHACNAQPVRRLFMAYLNDLQKERMLYDFSVDTANRDNAVTYDVTIRLTPYRSPKKLKIHVGTYTPHISTTTKYTNLLAKFNG